jgi:hypothetical protein
LEDLGIEGRIILKDIYKNGVCGCGLHWAEFKNGIHVISMRETRNLEEFWFENLIKTQDVDVNMKLKSIVGVSKILHKFFVCIYKVMVNYRSKPAIGHSSQTRI